MGEHCLKELHRKLYMKQTIWEFLDAACGDDWSNKDSLLSTAGVPILWRQSLVLQLLGLKSIGRQSSFKDLQF